MLRLTTLLLFCLLVAAPLSAQTYVTLWKQVESAQSRDLPQDERALLQQIATKAQKDKEYGHLLKAQLQEIAVVSTISSDSLAPLIERFALAAAAAKDEAAQAVYYTALGYLYHSCSAALSLSAAAAESKAQDCYDLALRNIPRLAKTKARTFEPLAVPGTSSTIFNNDLLHLVAGTAERYAVLVDYYTHAGNRRAACLAALYAVRAARDVLEQQKKTKYIATLDSLIHEYYDLDVAAEIAIERLNVMETTPDISAEEKIEFIDDALIRWQQWPRAVVLRNARSRITLPAYSVNIPSSLTIPDRAIPVYITSLRNIGSIHMAVYSVAVAGSEDYDPRRSDDYHTLASKRSDKPVATDSRTYYALPEFREVRDTLTIAPLPVGVYLVEFTTDNSSIATERVLLHISNLRVVDMSLPGDNMRLVAVDATTGQPLPHAKIHLKFRQWRDQHYDEETTTLETEEDGEVQYSSTISPYQYRVSTADDKAFPWQTISRRKWHSTSDYAPSTAIKIYSDRAVYRPAQDVNVSLLVYDMLSQEEWQVKEGQQVTVVMRDNKRAVVAEQTVTTDQWGVATAQFSLPSAGGTGIYTLSATTDGASATNSLRVEEYQRPSFFVDIADCQQAYKSGDTLTVTLRASSFAGVPVANATVAYTVTSSLRTWWRPGSNSSSEELAHCTTTTDSAGEAQLRIPLAFPSSTKKGDRQAQVTVRSEVCSPAGETHTATSSYPLSDKETLFLLSGDGEKQCKEQPTPCTLVYLNAAGQPLSATATYTLDGGTSTAVATNTPFLLPVSVLTTGPHTLHAVCRGDTLSLPFVVFSLADSVCPVDTAAWYYSTTCQQSNYVLTAGKEEYIVFGTTRPQQVVFYTVASTSTVLESGQVTLSNEVQKRTIVYDEAWGDGVAIRYSWVRDGILYSFSESLARPVRDCQLDVAFTTFRDHLTPGSDEEWTIRITDSEGSPATAHLLAVLYDKALDAIVPHQWTLVHRPSYTAPTIAQNAAYSRAEKYIYGEQNIRYLTEPALHFYSFAFPTLRTGRNDYVQMITPTRALRTMAPAATAEMAAADNEECPLPATESTVTPRQNFTETAFFLPQLTTEKDGTVAIRFTLPESATTWRFLAVAHDRAMNVGTLQGEVVAQKPLMIRPNMPRFLRQGDKSTLAATVDNTSAAALTTVATLTLSPADGAESVFRAEKTSVVPAESSSTVVFDMPSDLAAGMYICKVTVASDDTADGEQHYLPILSNDVAVVTTRAFTVTTAGEKTLVLDTLYGANSRDETLTVEYTDNPAWLLLEALPALATPSRDDAISLATAIYANGLSALLLSTLPDTLFKEKRATLSSAALVPQLRALQGADGGFAWCQGMAASWEVSLTVARQMLRLQHVGGTVDTALLSKVVAYLDEMMSKRVEKMKEREEKEGKRPVLSDDALDYLYLQALAATNLSALAKDNATYLLASVDSTGATLSLYGKAHLAIIAAHHPLFSDRALAQQLVESLRQYTVYDEERGRYFDSPKAPYSWCDYTIPTETAALEAFLAITPSAHATIREMQQWLLQERRTQLWDSPLTSAAAIYAFFADGTALAATAIDSVADPSRRTATAIYVDGERQRADASLAEEGYFSWTQQGRYSTVSAVQEHDGIAWGAVQVAYTQPLEEVADDSDALTVQRVVVAADGAPLTLPLTVGQRVIVRTTITSRRDLDFVEVVDGRPACLFPVSQLSSYHHGYYEAPGDEETVYSFEHLAKGQHVVETEYFVDRQGMYRAGLATATCCYAPSYAARDGSYTIVVE